ncbi:MAG: MarR family transcriptional regulator [Actinomycetota bacterium]|nr:MarR family transcriptional regulator [Actinomycetota bacterium]
MAQNSRERGYGGSADRDADTSASVSWQVARASEEHGVDFEPRVLSLTLTLYRAVTAYERAGAAELAPHNLTTSHLNILTVLHRAEHPLTMGELGRAVSVRPANLTGVVDALVTRSFVERQINPGDRRSYLIANTTEGDAFLAGFLPAHWRYLEKLTSGLSNDERLQLAALLERLRESVDTAERSGLSSSDQLVG